MVMAHSMGVISLRITSSVSSSGQWATKLRMASEEKGAGVLVRTVPSNITEYVSGALLYHTVLQLGPPE